MRVIYVSLIIVIIDQITKLFVKGFSIPFMNIKVQGLNYAEKHEILGSFFRITFVENPGMAFGIDLGLSSKLFLSLFSVFASIAIVYYLYKIKKYDFKLRLSLALILGGAVGNLIDRVFYGVIFDYAPLFYGKVVDFLDFDFFDISILGYAYDRWPIFNVADMAVTLGVLMLILFSSKKAPDELPMPVTENSGDCPVTESDNSSNSINKDNAGNTNDESDNGKDL